MQAVTALLQGLHNPLQRQGWGSNSKSLTTPRFFRQTDRHEGEKLSITTRPDVAHRSAVLNLGPTQVEQAILKRISCGKLTTVFWHEHNHSLSHCSQLAVQSMFFISVSMLYDIWSWHGVVKCVIAVSTKIKPEPIPGVVTSKTQIKDA